jgi:hypothetical protein
VGGADCGCWNDICHAYLTEEDAKALCAQLNRQDDDGLTYAVRHLVIEG